MPWVIHNGQSILPPAAVQGDFMSNQLRIFRRMHAVVHAGGQVRPRNATCRRRFLSAILLAAAIFGAACGRVSATEVVLNDGRVLYGKLGKTAGVAESPQASGTEGDKLALIYFLDDGLRRTYFSQRQVREIRPEENRRIEETFSIHQRVLRTGPTVRGVGAPMRIDPFDEFGRRIFTMPTAKEPVHVIQGITELTPSWARVEGISHVWDMRIATSSIPRETLHKILLKQIDPKNVEQRKKIARFYLQAERYEEAQEALDELLAAFPDLPDLKEQLAPSIRAIRQLSAARLVSELELRRDAGQHRLVSAMLRQFPAEGVGGEVLQGVRDMLQKHEIEEARRQDVIKHLKTIADGTADTIQRENLQPILAEIAAELGPNTIGRMAAFLQNADDRDAPEANKLALAISGWLLGADAATDNLGTAISAYKVRGLIYEYLNGKTVAERQRAFSYVRLESGGKPEMVVELLAHMKPPADPPAPVPDKPGFFAAEAPGLAEDSPTTYYVQLPPEYDPYRLYPAIVALHGEAGTALGQVDWWAGQWDKDGRRSGQASRRGYIVIAPEWTEPHQRQYGYSAREHAAVLNALRDACRRFSIDTDRVYLSGQSIGGDAAWDLGLAHPDLWAGVIPIVAQADRYCALYWQNARYVPYYVVAGELDGSKLIRNARELDRYLRRGYNATVVEFLGRGHEDFYDEILRLFDWMGRLRRDFYPREFVCETMRSWDNFFWWVEVEGLPPRSLVDPADWPPPRGTQPLQVSGLINKTNGINVRTGAKQVSVWLSPKMINFQERAAITINGRRAGGSEPAIQADLGVILEDVRTRADRQHPFWARVDAATGRIYSE